QFSTPGATTDSASHDTIRLATEPLPLMVLLCTSVLSAARMRTPVPFGTLDTTEPDAANVVRLLFMIMFPCTFVRAPALVGSWGKLNTRMPARLSWVVLFTTSASVEFSISMPATLSNDVEFSTRMFDDWPT